MAAMDGIKPSAQSRDIRMEAQFSSKIRLIQCDPARLQQIIWNLLNNAIKFTANAGRVSIFLQDVESGIEIAVSDTGQGISREFLPHVFDRFRQADSSTTRKHGGLGLGLAIVKHLAEIHGGSVTAESDGENCGATFRLHLPVVANIIQDEEYSQVLNRASKKFRLGFKVTGLN